MLTRDEVIWGYRYVLGRNPDAHAIDVHCRHSDVATFRRILLESYEFRSLGIGPYAETKWVIVPGPAGDDLIWVNLGDRVIGYEVVRGNYDPALTRVLGSLIKSGDTVLDIGANIGWYTLLAAKLVGTAGYVFAFEPNPDIAAHLRASVKLNAYADRVAVHQEALADRTGRTFLARPRKIANYGNAYILQDVDDVNYERHEVELIRLDDIGLTRLDVIKADCEGAEALAMTGASAAIERFRPIVVSEIFDAQLRLVSNMTASQYFDTFKDRGYVAFMVEDGRPFVRLDRWVDLKGIDHINVAFVPREREAELAGVFRDLAAQG